MRHIYRRSRHGRFILHIIDGKQWSSQNWAEFEKLHIATFWRTHGRSIENEAKLLALMSGLVDEVEL